ncbi:MAG: ABC transporter ATP-binding protein [Alkalispirochaeta sp.]
MIQFTGVTKRYGSLTAVSNLNLSVENGSVTVLIGPSGCGKSTTLRMINRLLEPDDGIVEVDEMALRDYDPAQLRLKIGYVIQSVGLLPHMRVRQNISIVPRLLGWEKQRRRERVDELLETVGLDPARYRNMFPAQLSGGEAQRVGVARALAADPPYLLMDEPFGAVDPLTRTVLQRSFREIQSRLKKTVVLVTHDLDEAIYLADRIALMKDGILQQEGTAADLLLHPVNDFVREFTGNDRMLRMLGTVELEYLEGWDGADGSRPTLRDAMSHLLATEGKPVKVRRAGRSTGDSNTDELLDFETLRSMVPT